MDFSSLTSDRRFRLLVESIEDYAIYMLDSFGHVVTWTRGAELHKGYTSEEVIGRHFSLFFVPEEVEAGIPAKRLEEASRLGRSAGDGWRLRKNGERFWAHFVITAMHDEKGRLTGFSKVTDDRTARKRENDALITRELAIREERDTLRAAVESSMDALYICRAVRDAAGEIEDFIFTFVNANVPKMTSVPIGEILGGRLCELFPVIRTEGIYEMYKQVVLTGKPIVFEFPVQAANVISAWLRVQAVKLRDGVAITASDITARKLDEERIVHLAHHDPLTGLPNRLLMNDRIEQAIERAKRYHEKVAVFLVDLDSFKQINDTLGHAAGDAVLVNIAVRLKAAVRATDSVMRIGGDEFVIVMPDITEHNDILLCAEKMLHSLQLAIEIEEKEVYMSCSIGIAIYPQGAESPEELLAAADAAMYMAKRSGKNQIRVSIPQPGDDAYPVAPAEVFRLQGTRHA